MNENKNKELDRLNGVYKKLLDGANVAYFEGFGKVLDPHTVEVDGKKFTVSRPQAYSFSRPIERLYSDCGFFVGVLVSKSRSWSA